MLDSTLITTSFPLARITTTSYGTLGMRSTVSDLFTEVDIREGQHPSSITIRANNWGEYGSTAYVLHYSHSIAKCAGGLYLRQHVLS
jgi:hypothetical protein